MFIPGEVQTRNPFQNHIPGWVVQPPVVSDQWSTEMAVLQGHTDIISFIACSPVADLVVSLSGDKTARIWDTVTGTERFTFHDSASYSCAAFSPDGKSIAFGSEKPIIDIKEFTKGTTLYLANCDGGVSEVVYSPKTGSMLASVSSELTLKIWSVDEGYAKHVLPVTFLETHSREGTCQFTPNEEYLVVAGSTQSMTMWETQTGQCVKTFDLFDTGFVSDFKIFKDGSMVAMTTGLRKVAIMDLLSGEKQAEYSGMEYRGVISPPDGTSVSAQTANNDIVLLNDANPLGLRQSLSTDMGKMVVASRDGRLLVSDDSQIQYSLKLWDIHSNSTLDEDHIGRKDVTYWESFLGWNLGYGYNWMTDKAQLYESTGRPLILPLSTVRKISFSPDGKFVALQVLKINDYWDDNNINHMGDINLCELWDSNMNTEFFVEKRWREASLSLDGNYLALYPTRNNGKAEVVRSTTFEGAMTWQLSGVSCMAFSPDDEITALFYILPGSSEQVYELWSTQRRKKLHQISVEYCANRRDRPGLEFSPDSNFVALRMKTPVDEYHDEWKLLNLATREEGNMRCWGEPVFRPRSYHLAVGRDFSVEIRETSTLVLQQRFDLAGGFIVGVNHCGMAFSTNGRFVSTSGNRDNRYRIVQQWDITSGSETGRYVVEGNVNHPSYCGDTYLVCDQGRLPLPVYNPEKDTHGRTVDAGAQDLLFVGYEWVYRGLERLMWLPLQYRSPDSQIRGNTLVLNHNHKSGGVKIIKFDLAGIPVRDGGPEPSRH